MSYCNDARRQRFLAFCLSCLVVVAGCQYGKETRPVAPLGDSTLGLYARMMQGDHFFSDLGAEGLKRVIVTRVAPGGPAAQAGIHPGAIILKVDGHSCRKAESLIHLVRNLEAGRVINVLVHQDGGRQNMKVRVARSNDVWTSRPGISFSEMVGPARVLHENNDERENDDREEQSVPGLYTD